MIIQLPPTEIKTTLDELFPRTAPGLRYRITQLWQQARRGQWTTLEPMPEQERERVRTHVVAFASLVRGRPVDEARAVIQWGADDLEQAAADVDAWLRGSASSRMVKHMQALLGKVDIQYLTRLTRAGAATLGMPPILYWNDAALPAPLEPRRWTRAWIELEQLTPNITRSLAACLLTYLLAATIEAIQLRREETPFASLVTMLLGGAWVVRVTDDGVSWVVDLGELLEI